MWFPYFIVAVDRIRCLHGSKVASTILVCADAPICINTVLWNTIKLLFPKHAANAPESPADAILTPSSANNAALVANAVAALPMRRIGLIHAPFNPPRSAALASVLTGEATTGLHMTLPCCLKCSATFASVRGFHTCSQHSKDVLAYKVVAHWLLHFVCCKTSSQLVSFGPCKNLCISRLTLSTRSHLHE